MQNEAHPHYEAAFIFGSLEYEMLNGMAAALIKLRRSYADGSGSVNSGDGLRALSFREAGILIRNAAEIIYSFVAADDAELGVGTPAFQARMEAEETFGSAVAWVNLGQVQTYCGRIVLMRVDPPRVEAIRDAWSLHNDASLLRSATGLGEMHVYPKNPICAAPDWSAANPT